MKINAKKYALVLFDTLKDKNDKEVNDLLDKFLKILAKNHHLALGLKIIYYLEQLYKKAGLDLELKCVSARPLNKELLENLAKHFNINKIKEEIKPDLLGGIILRYQDKIIDASLKTGLKNLNNYLKI